MICVIEVQLWWTAAWREIHRRVLDWLWAGSSGVSPYPSSWVVKNRLRYSSYDEGSSQQLVGKRSCEYYRPLPSQFLRLANLWLWGGTVVYNQHPEICILPSIKYHIYPCIPRGGPALSWSAGRGSEFLWRMSRFEVRRSAFAASGTARQRNASELLVQCDERSMQRASVMCREVYRYSKRRPQNTAAGQASVPS